VIKYIGCSRITRMNASVRLLALKVSGARVALAVLLSGAMACGLDKQAVGVAIDPADLLQKVEAEYRTYNLSRVEPYDTVTLNVRGVSGIGTTIEAPILYGYDDRYVTISPEGVLKAIAPVASTSVTMTMTFGGSTRVDTIRVSVIAEAPQPVQRVAIAVNAGDSAKGTNGPKILRLIRESVDGANMATLLVSVRSSDTATAKIAQSGGNLQVTPVRIGRVVLHVSTYAYGLGMRDSLPFLVGWPLIERVGSYTRYDRERKQEILDFKNGNVTIGVGACVTWINLNRTSDLDVVFEDSANVLSADSAAKEVLALCKVWSSADTVGTGKPHGENISPWRGKLFPNGGVDALSTGRSRAFRKPGIYRYRSVLNGSTGTITVCDEKNDPTCSPETYQWGTVNP